MENPKVLNRLYDAVDLLKLLEHIADGQTNASRSTEAPWGGIRLILAQARDLVDAAVDEAQVGDGEPVGARTVVKSSRRRNSDRDLESIVNPGNEYNEGRSAGMVREIGESPQTGTFNRLQLPRESASGEVL